MKKNIVLYLVYFIFINADLALGQNFITYIYNDENGLVSNLAKSLTQDDEGYIWVATDAGISKFDGNTFTNFQKNLPSLYVKQIINLPSHKLEIVTDFGIGQIITKSNEFVYKPILTSGRNDLDHSLYYPKNIFQDSFGNSWISDLSGISKYKNGKIYKYSFNPKYNADSYFRSYLVTELGNHKIIASSQKGFLFYFNQIQNKFIKLSFDPPSNNFYINALIKYNNNSFLIGTSDGLYLGTYTGSFTSVNIKKISDIKQISSIALSHDDIIFLGTWDNGLYYQSISNTTNYIFNKFNNSQFISIKDLLVDKQNNLWVASDQGLGLIKKTSFGIITQPNLSQKDTYLYAQQIYSDNRKNLYYTDGNSIYKILNENSIKSQATLLKAQDASIISFAVGKSGYWVSYRNHSLEYRDFKSNQVIFKYELKDDSFNSIFIDRDNNLWTFLPRRRNIMKFDKKFNTQIYTIDSKDFDFINLFAQSTSGAIYCAGSGSKLSLFKLDNKLGKFFDIAPIFNSGLRTQIQIYDIQFDKNKIYLASTEGLLLLSGNKLNKVNLASYYNDNVIKAIRLIGNKIWLGTEKGIIVIQNEGEVNFDTQDGLPNSSITVHGLLLDSKNKIWVATASGIAYWQLDNDKLASTSKPLFKEFKIIQKGEQSSVVNTHEFIAGTSINCSFVALTYPTNRTLYEYRLNGYDSAWSTPNTLNSINLYSLPSGNYDLQVKAKSPGYLWSPISDYPLIITPPWYLSSIFIFIYLIITLFVIVIIVESLYNSKIKRMQLRENLLSQMVNEKTNDLLASKTNAEKLLEESEEAKRELEDATEQKSHMLSVAAHDLKNPLQSIIGFASIIDEETDNEEIRNMAGIILSSSRDMLQQINEMLDAAAVESKNLKLDLKPISINKILADVIKNNYRRAAQKGQTIITYLGNDCEILLDEHWFKIALDNIINNAIKYSPFDSQILATTELQESFILIKIKDEGAGLTSDDLKKLFNRYQRLSAKPTGGETSTGLGLSIVKDIIDFHGGKIWAESSNGQGSTFIIQLSLSTEKV